jgi:hypothetical protein
MLPEVHHLDQVAVEVPAKKNEWPRGDSLRLADDFDALAQPGDRATSAGSAR